MFKVFTHRDDEVNMPGSGVSQSIPEVSLPKFPKEKGFPMVQKAVRRHRTSCSPGVVAETLTQDAAVTV